MTELFTQVDAVLAKLVQFCVDHGLGYSYSLDMGGLTWHMKDYNSGVSLRMSITRHALRSEPPAEVVRRVLNRWELEKLKR